MKIDNYDCIMQWSYKLAKNWVQKHLLESGINSSRKFEQYKREGHYLPKYFPRKPDDYFKKNQVWKGWSDFFGKSSGILEKEYLSYADASDYCRQKGIKNSVEYRSWKNKPSNLPARPDQYYKNEWEDWKDFLGGTYRIPPKRVVSKLQLSDVRIIRHQLKLGVPGVILAKTFGVSEMQISRIKKGDNWITVE